MRRRAQAGTVPELKLVTMNFRGLAKDYDKLLSSAKKWKKQHGVAVLCGQEHNLHPDKETEHKRSAIAKGFTLSISYAPAAPDGKHLGGTLILTDNATIDKTTQVVTQPGMPPISVSGFSDSSAREGSRRTTSR